MSESGVQYAPAAGSTGRSAVQPAADLSQIVGKNLRRFRVRQGLSLERLAKHSGVSRAMLSQIETGKSTPTIGLLGKIAAALGLPVVRLITESESSSVTVLRRDHAKILTSNDGRYAARLLFPGDGQRRVEFYEVRLSPRHDEDVAAHAPGTRGNLIVSEGAVEVVLGDGRSVTLDEGDALAFDADSPHHYRNRIEREAVLYLVIAYAEPVG